MLTWGFGVSRRMFSFLFDCCQLFVPTAGSFGWRAQIVSRSARRAAAKRLDLDASEHAIRLWWSGGCGADSSFSSGDLRFEPVFAIWFRVPDQTHIRSSRARDCTNIPLAAGQARGRDHSSLRHLKPCNPSVRPPGSAEADRSSADWFEDCERGCLRRRTSSRLPQSRRRRSRTSTRPRAACAPAPRSCACGRAGCWR
ncbi:hypothetical protein ACVWW5_005077 [Bradyrhizobium sp. LM3.4]